MRDTEAESRRLLGNKAWNLLRRRAQGYSVPPFFILDRNFFFRFLGDKQERYAELLRNPSEETGAELRALLESCTFGEEAAEKLRRELQVAMPRAERFAVRSSFILEGEERHSFDGLFQSVLEVPRGDELLQAVKECYLSCFSERAACYMLQYGLFDESMAVAVILQDMAGNGRNFTVYTTNPQSGNPEELLAEYLDAAGKQQRTVLDLAGRVLQTTERAEAEEADEEREVLFVRLAALALELEASNVPQTACCFEFAVEPDGELRLLRESEMSSYRHLDKRVKHFYLDAAGRNGAADGVLTPLGFELLRGLYQKAGKEPLLFEGRVYTRREGGEEAAAEASPSAELLQRLPQHYQLSHYLQTAEQEEQTEAEAELPETVEERWRKIVNLSDGFTALGRFAAEAEASARSCYAELLRELRERSVPNAEGLLNAALMGQGGMKSAESVQALSALLRTVQESEALRELVLSQSAQELEGLCWRVRTEEGSAQNECSVFAGEVQHYLKHYGSCTSAKYLLERESYRQNPQPLFAFLKQYAAAKPVEVRSEQSEVSAKAQEELFKTLGFLGKLRGKRLLQELIFFLRARENLDFLAQSRVDRLRRQVLQLGELLTRRGELAEARDISYLKRDELERAFSAGGGSTAVFRSLQAGISERRREQERYAALPRCSHLCCFGSLARENMTVLRESLTQEELSVESERLFLRGIPCGAVREGEASFFDGETLPRASGAVLLANHCTEKLFPLLALSRGLVLERGNLWSHEAVVARELGLLSLIRVPGLFRAVREGEWLRADGRRGILERASEGDAERIEEVEV